MTCRTGSVQRAADQSIDAQTAVEKLEAALRAKEEAYKAEFFSRIEDNLAKSGITDAEQTDYSSDIKTEYTSEFSLDAIAKVVTSTLEALAASSVGGATPVITPKAIESYVDVVNSVAEAAKSSSDSAANLSFAMNRIGPGTYAFLFATSTTIHNEDTFGSESITTTAIFHRLMRSLRSVEKDAKFDAAVIDAELLKKMKHLQAALMDRLANGDIDFATYDKLDTEYMSKVKEIQHRLEEARFDSNTPFTVTLGAEGAVEADQTLKGALPQTRLVAQDAIADLSARGGDFAKAAERNSERLASGYY